MNRMCVEIIGGELTKKVQNSFKYQSYFYFNKQDLFGDGTHIVNNFFQLSVTY